MTTYRKPLQDKDGNTIIPAMAGDQTGWIQTGDLANSAVTSDKIDFTVQSGTITIPSGSSVGSINSTYCYCRKFGKIVDIEIRGALAAGSSWTSLTSKNNQLLIPSGFTPINEVTGNGYIASTGLLSFWIASDGKVELRPYDTFTVPKAGQNFGGHIMYITN